MKHKLASQKDKPLPRFRLLRVYRTLLVVGCSYLGWTLSGRLRSKHRQEERLVHINRINARRVEAMILEVKGLFIKVGQLLSIMTNFLPAAFREGLAGVQDQVPPCSEREIKARIQHELGGKIEELFDNFDPVPIASASLAQVHQATLPDGRRVAVKVQHSYIEAIATRDLATMGRIVGMVGFFIRLQGLKDAFQQIREMIFEELDFSREAANIREIGANLAENKDVFCPHVVDGYATQRVLTTSLEEGIKITDDAALDAANHDRRALAEKILAAYCQMLFQDGLYHADPHPGNLLIAPDGRIVLLDFGAVGRLSPAMKAGIPRFLEAVLRRDDEKIREELRAMGFVARHARDEDGERIIRYFQNRFLELVPLESWSLKDIHMDLQTKLEIMSDFRELDITFRDLMNTFQIPRDWAMLFRTLLLLVGLVTQIDPAVNPMTVIRPYLKEMALGKDRDWKQLVALMIKDLVVSALTLPQDLKQLLHKANEGDLTIKIDGQRERTKLLYSLGHQFLFGMLVLGSGTLAYLARGAGDTNVATVASVACLVFTLGLGGSVFAARKWR